MEKLLWKYLATAKCGTLDLCLFSNRDCWINSSKTGVLVLLQKNALNFIVSPNKVSREVHRHFEVTLFLGSLNSDLVYRRYRYAGGDTEIILFRESYCALCVRMK